MGVDRAIARPPFSGAGFKLTRPIRSRHPSRIEAERRVRAVALLPAFYTRIYALRYGEDAIEVYHDRSECRIGRLIVRDGNQELGTDGRRRCEECRKYGPA